MLYGLLVSLFIFVCLFLILIILVQQSKSNMGLGNMGGGAQMLFGGSGGQELIQKVTWVLGALFMGGSLVLALMKSSNPTHGSYAHQSRMPISSEAPATPGMPEEY